MSKKSKSQISLSARLVKLHKGEKSLNKLETTVKKLVGMEIVNEGNEAFNLFCSVIKSSFSSRRRKAA